MEKGNDAVLILGAGEMASGAAFHLVRSGFRVTATELAKPLALRRTVSFAGAVFDGESSVEGVTGRLGSRDDGPVEGVVLVCVDPEGTLIELRRWRALVDARMARRNLGVRRGMAPLVIGMGPGFEAGKDVDLVVETSRGPDLGRVIRSGPTRPNTGLPDTVKGRDRERVIRAPCDGEFRSTREIGEIVRPRDLLGRIGDVPVRTPIGGLLRGLVHDGVPVWSGKKVADVYPDTSVDYRKMSDKARAVGEGVVRAVLS